MKYTATCICLTFNGRQEFAIDHNDLAFVTEWSINRAKSQLAKWGDCAHIQVVRNDPYETLHSAKVWNVGNGKFEIEKE